MTIIDTYTNCHSGPRSLVARGQYGNQTTIWKTYGMKIVQCKYYTPSNPQTSVQQANRYKFASAVSLWKAMPEAEKDFWADVQKCSRRYRRTPPRNVYISFYMLDKA